MKLTNISNIDGFFEAVNDCKGDVYLVTQEGDKLNLKSSLCKYVAFSQIFGGSGLEMELETTKPEDTHRFIHFAMTNSVER